MREISLKELLEAGCHFGHKTTRWHPKAASFIYQSREGVHIIDLVKTRDWLKKAGDFVLGLGKNGQTLLCIASKRQAKGVVSQAAKRAGLPFMTSRWIGGFVTNWDEVKKNIERMNSWRKEKTDGTWEKYPKHEVIKLNKLLRKVEMVYAGVENLTKLPEAVFIVDINKEVTALREVTRREIPIVAMVDTNADPNLADYPIPANDDAVGSIQYVVNYLIEAYLEGKKIGEKKEEKKVEKAVKAEKKEEKEKKDDFDEKKPKKRGRPKKK
ncbi:30S ribosomal protein S2 [Candidatus Gottesmanbacteria bacterium RIFCSPHIGHO2_02_FULL_39_14]|uniref:Small ribosomal subunit protein uS2 n=2 Tax=Candidatus Gottesmaniibacteriota TaxID=1752720 RepID=A0A1F6A2W5_9BACT|nr:MAG: 30S ribosomal protein S2 [Candidatus Gottesmanbacteria bacterium RIFCSPHIGHO2_02_FULL_39_14]OGG31404.1 MAG: 30S ribosomal protein S2 [Candidatus Gottesmanbacteria bacterium RIFCSPLOWO2_02_FULL_38_8]